MAPRKSPQPLSPKELRVLEFIESFLQDQAVAPTYQEIREHFGFASFNSVQRYLKQLQDKNYIHIPGGNQKRAIEVLHSSKSVVNLLADRMSDSSVSSTTQYPFPTQKKETPPKSESPLQVESLSLPLLGRVAAGAPIEAFTHNEFVDVPSTMIRNPSKTFALVVQGQSMIEDGILDGDVIFVQRQTYANNGDTVVAMVNNQATVKRFYLHRRTEGAPATSGGRSDGDIHRYPQSDSQSTKDVDKQTESRRRDEAHVELRPANSTMKSMWFAPFDVGVQGIVVGLLRRF